MKALVKKHAERGLWLEDVPEPEIGINDVLIRVERTGICGTDLHIYNWDPWAQKTVPVPMVIGHEFAGTVVDVGDNVHDFKPGDIVSGEGHVVCGHCRNCLAGRRHLCNHTMGVGVNRPGAFAELVAIPQANVWYHDQTLDRDIMAIFDPFGNAVHTALSFDVLGEDVLITGAGPIGLMAIKVARHAGARHVVITDVNEFRLGLARQMGATLAVDVRTENLAEVQKQLDMQEGFDIGLEMSGNASAFRDMLANMAHGGCIALLGIPPEEIAIDWNDGRLQRAPYQGHLRARDVRDVVQNDVHAPVWPRHRRRHHPPHAVCRVRRGFCCDERGQERQSRPRLDVREA